MKNLSAHTALLPLSIFIITTVKNALKFVVKFVINSLNLILKDANLKPNFFALIEPLTRTYKSHLKSMCGFKNKNGAVSLTALFITYYNFLRSHSSLKYNPPIKLDFLDPPSTLPARWATILNKAIDLDLAA